MPVVSWSACLPIGRLFDRTGVSGVIAELSARYGISANATNATAAE
jgi:hypothetical protein